jgi:hypothetical protein
MAHEMKIRKTAIYMETIHGEAGNPVEPPVCRGFAAAVVENPCLGLGDLVHGEECGAALGELLTRQILDALKWMPGTTLAYGKAAIVGVEGSSEHAAAILHPRMGRPLRSLIGQGKAIIPSTVKRGQPGAQIDIPLHGAENEWDFAQIDAIEACVMDAPLPREIVIFVALAQGGRPGAKIGH